MGVSIDQRVMSAIQRARTQMALLVDTDFRVVWANEGARRFFGAAADPGQYVLDRVHPDDLEVAVTGLATAVDDSKGTTALANAPRGVFIRVMDHHNEWVPVDASLDNLLHDDAVGGLLINLRRVANRMHLDRSIELLADDSDLADTLTSALAYFSDEMRATAASIATRVAGETMLVGVSTPEAQGLAGLFDGWGPLSVGKLHEPTVHAVADLPPDEATLASAVGVTHVISLPVHDTHSKIVGALIAWLPHEPVYVDPPNGAGRFVGRIVRLAILQERAKRSLLHQARHDPLTGLANRVGLDRVLDNLGPDELPAALLYCDLDDFKVINDSYGHSVGDLLLKQVARRISVAIRSDDVAVRMGGDEFVIVCPRVSDPEIAGIIAERVRARVEQPTGSGDGGLTPEISIGWAVAETISEVGTLIDAADDALFENKRLRKSAEE